MIYDSAAQQSAAMPSVQFRAAPGWQAGPVHTNDLGTIYMPDTTFISETIGTNLYGQLCGFASLSKNSLLISNTWVRFPAEGFILTVTNDATVFGPNGRLDLGGCAVHHLSHLSLSGSNVPPTFNVGGNLILTNGGSLSVYSAMTNIATNYGALVSVSGNITIGSNCWIYPNAHPLGGPALMRMRNLYLTGGTNSGINADERGYPGGPQTNTSGYGPGGGAQNKGGGYGGLGGGAAAPYGQTYGSSNLPLNAGSGGGGAAGSPNCMGGDGGGCVRIEAEEIVANGVITANGGRAVDGDYRGGGGSGGGIYLRCQTFSGTTNTVFRANGGAGGSNPTANSGGGGGRIAVWRIFDHSSGAVTTSVTGGSGWGTTGATGEVGTVVWGWRPPKGTIFSAH